MGLEKRVLDDVFGVLDRAGQPVRHAEDVPGVTLDQRTEGVVVAVTGQGNGRRVAVRPASVYPVHSESLTEETGSG